MGKQLRTAIDKLAVSLMNMNIWNGLLELARSIASAGGADIHIYTDSLDRAAFSEGDKRHCMDNPWFRRGISQCIHR